MMDSKPGLYDSVLVLDYKSLYLVDHPAPFLIDPAGLAGGHAPPRRRRTPCRASARFLARDALPARPIAEQVVAGARGGQDATNTPLSQALKIIIISLRRACWGRAAAASSIRVSRRRSRCAGTRSCICTRELDRGRAAIR